MVVRLETWTFCIELGPPRQCGYIGSFNGRLMELTVPTGSEGNLQPRQTHSSLDHRGRRHGDLPADPVPMLVGAT